MAPNAESCHPQTVQSQTVAKKEKALVGIEGKWYDVSSLLESHPGGPIIKSYVGRDATEVFRAFHGEHVLSKRRPVGEYDVVAKRLEESSDITLEEVNKYLSIQRDLAELDAMFKREGWYGDNTGWLARQCVLCATLFGAVLMGVLFVMPRVEPEAQWFISFGAGVLLAAFWQQSGFLMHDFMHSNVFQQRLLDEKWGVFFGTVCLGVPSHWWKDEHDIHHALTNTFTRDPNSQDFDIQMLQKMWSQDEQLLQFSDGTCTSNPKFPSLPLWVTVGLVKVQHLTFIPLCVFLGRFGIILDSYTHEERELEWNAIRVHWAWMVGLLIQFPSWTSALQFYIVAAICQGILHIQLLISHFAEPFEESSKTLTKGFFALHQIEACTNIVNSPYTDWFYGGLNFHIEHHLFPRLPRQRLRRAAPFVRAICNKYHLEYKEGTFPQIVSKVIHRLKSIGHLVQIPDIRH